VHPEGCEVLRKSSLSYFGVNSETIFPYALGLLGGAYFIIRVNWLIFISLSASVSFANILSRGIKQQRPESNTELPVRG